MTAKKTLILVGAALAAISLFPSGAYADSMDDEINYLISEIGKHGCSFIRNGRRYSSRDARAHLRSKRRKNAHLIDSTEEFIEKIASGSVSSGRPYLVRCKGKDEQPAGEWFTSLLDDYRNQAD